MCGWFSTFFLGIGCKFFSMGIEYTADSIKGRQIASDPGAEESHMAQLPEEGRISCFPGVISHLPPGKATATDPGTSPIFGYHLFQEVPCFEGIEQVTRHPGQDLWGQSASGPRLIWRQGKQGYSCGAVGDHRPGGNPPIFTAIIIRTGRRAARFRFLAVSVEIRILRESVSCCPLREKRRFPPSKFPIVAPLLLSGWG